MKANILRPNRRKNRKRDLAYLQFIREQPCLLCWRNGRRFGGIWGKGQETLTEAAHVGERGLGTKCDDREAIPLCAFHHRTGNESHHVLGKLFWGRHKLDKAELIAKYNQLFEDRD